MWGADGCKCGSMRAFGKWAAGIVARVFPSWNDGGMGEEEEEAGQVMAECGCVFHGTCMLLNDRKHEQSIHTPARTYTS